MELPRYETSNDRYLARKKLYHRLDILGRVIIQGHKQARQLLALEKQAQAKPGTLNACNGVIRSFAKLQKICEGT